MNPNFALSLSFDGIRLLLRAAGGWRLVGEVPVTSTDLAGDLAALRETAVALRPGRVRTKLIIPDDQIRYLSVDTGDVDSATRLEAVRTALDGATPYALDALAFDFCEDGTTTHVAAVARETLTEAEAFATEHRFHPVSFVAAPHHQPFLGEPYFGKTAHASTVLGADQDVEPDGVCVVVIGNVEDMDADEPPAEVTTPPPTTPEPEVPSVEAEAEATTEAKDIPAPEAAAPTREAPADSAPVVPPAPPEPEPAPDDFDEDATLMLFSHRESTDNPAPATKNAEAAVPPAPAVPRGASAAGSPRRG